MAFRVLVVDDVDTNRLVLTDLLLRDGYAVTTADSGEAALRAMTADAPDLVLLDVMMPGLSGVEVCRRMRAEPATRDIAVILVTALADRESRLAGFAAEADDYLTKPVDGNELRLRVRAMARLRRYRNLLEERSRSAMITDHSPDAVLLCERDGRVLESNAAAQGLFAREHALTGRALTEIVNVTEPAAKEWLNGVEATPPGQPRPIPAVVHGSECMLEMSRAWCRWQDREVAIVVARDVTDLDRLRRTAERLRRHEAIAVAATGIAHDFRNYLTAIDLGLGLLEHELPAGATAARDTIATIQEQIHVGMSLTQKITSLGRGVAEPAPRGLDLQAALRSLEPLIRHWAGDAGLTLDLQPTPFIAAANDDVVQVVSNLVVNARQAVGADGEIVIRTKLDATGATGAVVLQVSDNGCGMAKETLDRVFEAYFSTKTARGGTGLGLAIVHEVVSRRGASIKVDSQLGAGSSFTVAWPVATPPFAESTAI